MLEPLIREKIKNYDTLGYFNLFWFKYEESHFIEPEFPRIVEKCLEDNKLLIDPVGVLEILCRRFCFSDRTLVSGILASPWMSRPNKAGDGWEYIQPPEHGELRLPPEDFADRLFNLLKKEILSYCQNARTIGVLLSGGMDSRISAMAIYALIAEGLLNANVVAVTWGLEGTRDVVYAKDIAKRFKWDWVHLPISPENLYENIEVAAEQGCLYPPIHLHAIPRVKDIPGLDCVLVSSFGDGMGRGVYSGRHLTDLTPMKRYLRNWFGLINSEVYMKSLPQAVSDLTRYRMLFPRSSEYAYLEIERQAHYMRRMLNPCIKYLNEFIPTFQVYTAPDILEFVWSVDPRYRNDKAYTAIVARHMFIVADIPWSKTGRPFGNQFCEPDRYPKDYHLYGKWIRRDLNDVLKSFCLSDDIAKLNVFNMKNVKRCLDFNSKSKADRVTTIDEISIWLASVAKMVRSYDIAGVEVSRKRSWVARKVDTVRPLIELWVFERAMDLMKKKAG